MAQLRPFAYLRSFIKPLGLPSSGCANWQRLDLDVPACLSFARVGVEINFVSFEQHTPKRYFTFGTATQYSKFAVYADPRYFDPLQLWVLIYP
jgi:hypothetical protein